jgi:DNA-binding transcriptional ArsR family regulator
LFDKYVYPYYCSAVTDELKSQLAQLAARLEKLEKQAPAKSAPGIDAERYWLIDKLTREGAKGGEVVYGGVVTVPTGEQYVWQKHGGVRELFKRDWAAFDRVLAALGHPVRLAILKALLEGKRSKADLEKLEGLGTTGQLYHHLKALEEAGWVRSLERGVYGVPGERVVPLMAILTAAGG